MRKNPTSASRQAWLIPILMVAGVCAGSDRAAAAGPADQSQCPAPPKVVGPDGIPGTADDGWIVEDFDTERDGTPGISLDRFPRGTPGVLNDTIGVWVGTASGGMSTLAGIGCAGFKVPPIDPDCRIDPDNDMDWHIHCPAGTCPNRPGLVTPDGGDFAFSGRNSLHWGHHFDIHSRNGDSTRFRQLAAFMTDPIHLTPVPGPGDLELSFFHVAVMMDNNSYNAPPGQANDFGDVQIQVFDAGAPGGGQWGFWDRLAPFQNVYDHISYIWSAFGTGPSYCVLTPTDTGSGGYAPRGVKETLCYPNGVWSHCGNARSTVTVHECDGPGVTGNTGGGLWVESKFSLAEDLGRTVRIRWIAESWEFDCCSQSYYQLGGPWSVIEEEDGWWIDDIKITGAVQYPAGQPAEHEVCNGIDDDCNGAVDEGLGQTSCGVGACARQVDNCADGAPRTCAPGDPTPEICNGLDDDCDGLVDEEIAPGTVNVAVDPPRLWPPNHRMVDVHITVTLDGGCSPACPTPPSIVLTSVTSDEPDDVVGGGDGNTVNDIQGAGIGSADFDLSLRAERDGSVDGRRYRMTYTATDCTGVTVGSAVVFVPHDMEGASEPISVTAEEISAGTGLAWPAVTGVLSYDVIRGNMANLRDAGESIDLGPVACIRSGSAEPMTSEYEDAEFPPLGKAFFYLVAYDDVYGTSGYGTASAAKPRIAGSGDCR
jgi:hypothetical protein